MVTPLPIPLVPVPLLVDWLDAMPALLPGVTADCDKAGVGVLPPVEVLPPDVVALTLVVPPPLEFAPPPVVPPPLEMAPPAVIPPPVNLLVVVPLPLGVEEGAGLLVAVMPGVVLRGFVRPMLPMLVALYGVAMVVVPPLIELLPIDPAIVVPLWREPGAPGVCKPEPPLGGAPALVAGAVEPLWTALTMISPNCSGSVSRPSVSMGSWKGWPRDAGGLPICPAGASRFWLRMALATSLAVMPSDANFCGSSQARML